MEYKVIRDCSPIKSQDLEEYEQDIKKALEELKSDGHDIKDMDHLEQVTPDSKHIISTTYIKYTKKVIGRNGRPPKY